MKLSSAKESKKLPTDTDSQFLSYHPIYPPGLPTLKEILESRLQDSVDMVVPFGIKTPRAVILPPDSSPRSDSFSKSVLGW